jgi:hypothetical protein
MIIASAALVSVALCAAMLVCMEAGFRGGRRYRGKDSTHEWLGLFQGAIFALLGLLLGFAFAGSMGRLEARRDLIVREANAINTAYLRIDILPPAYQGEIRGLFHAYLEARLQAYDNLDSGRDFEASIVEASRLQQQIWAKAIAAAGQDPAGKSLIVTSLNEMIDVTTARAVAWRTQLPTLILVLLLGVALLSSLLAGYGMGTSGRRHGFHGAIYAVAVSLTIYVVLDLDNPRSGMIRLDAAEQVLKQLHFAI